MAYKNVHIYMMDLTSLQAIFNSGKAESKSDYQISTSSEQERNKSPISLEYPSEPLVPPSPCFHNSFPKVSHKTNNNDSCGPGWSSKKVLAFIADELGINVSELSPTALFTDLGVDSLLSFSITTQLRDAGLDIPWSTPLFLSTVQEFEAFLKTLDCPANLQASPSSGNASSVLTYNIDSNH